MCFLLLFNRVPSIVAAVPTGFLLLISSANRPLLVRLRLIVVVLVVRVLLVLLTLAAARSAESQRHDISGQCHKQQRFVAVNCCFSWLPEVCTTSACTCNAEAFEPGSGVDERQLPELFDMLV